MCCGRRSSGTKGRSKLIANNAVVKHYGTVSIQENETFLLLHDNSTVKLTKVGESLEKLVGSKIVCEGDIADNQLLITSWQLVN
jgi:hypothetical protein